ncbi:MAG: tRNA (N(6)-L-threonylcarbamoyladenosine(37)-C(2))-methylthiotransferase MtaB [Chlamydiales bacterium]
MNQISKKFTIATLGCRTNQYESQAYSDQLKSLGFTQSGQNEAADLCIINTCTVTEMADKKSLSTLRGLIRRNPGAKIVVTGCLAEREKKRLQDIEGVSMIVPNSAKENLLALALDIENLPEFKINQFECHTRAFVKIQDGCNSYCSYCIIPFVRGRSRSKTIPEIVKEVEDLVGNGYKEIVLTGINIGDFDGGDRKNGCRLSELVTILDQIDGLERIRISSIDPDEVDDLLLKAVVNGKKTCHSMHIVLQAGSNTILKRMNRKYTKQDFLHTIHRLQDASPHFTFTTDVIVGFPGESESDFMETIQMVEEVRFAKVHIFPYSARPKTRSSRFVDPILPQEIQKRKSTLLTVANRVAFGLRNDFIGKELEVLIESADSQRTSGYMRGHTDNFLEVSVEPSVSLSPNTIVRVKTFANEEDSLLARCV